MKPAERDEQVKWYVDHGICLLKCNPKTKVPIEKWSSDVKIPLRPYQEFRHHNIALRLGEQYEDGYLCVVDVDPRNGGDETLAKLQREHGELPMTRMVKTGSGGYHWYWIMREPLKKCILGPGLDFQGKGSIVVGAGSIHESGRNYSWDMDFGSDYVEILPDWLEEKVKQKTTRLKVIYNSEDIDERGDKLKVPSGERNNFLTSRAGLLRSQGLSEQAIFAALKNDFNSRCEPPLSDAEMGTIVKSVCRYEPKPEQHTPTTKEIIPPVANEKKATAKQSSARPSVKASYFTKAYENLLADANGLVGDISETIFDSAYIQIPQWSLASALSVVSGACHGGMSLPAKNGDQTRPSDSLSLGNWIVGPAGSGKDHYLSVTMNLLKGVYDRLVVEEFNSFYGLRRSLYLMNAATFISDEFHDELLRFTRKDGSVTAMAMTDIKKIFTPQQRIDAIRIKRSSFPAINHPRLAMFFAGTVKGFLDSAAKSDIVVDGFLSRMISWPLEELTEKTNHAASHIVEWDSGITLGLKQLFEDSLTPAGKRQLDPATDDYDRPLDEYLRGDSTRCPQHVAQFDPTLRVMAQTPEACSLLQEYQDECRAIMRKTYAEDPTSGSNLSSLHARAGQLAARVAGVQARGRLSEEITAADIRFGVKLVRTNLEAVFKLMGESFGENHWHQQKVRVVSYLEKRDDADIRDICRTPLRGCKGKERTQLMLDLCADGLLEVINAKDGKPIELSFFETKLPRGARYRLRK